jgi:hypothetical protein
MKILLLLAFMPGGIFSFSLMADAPEPPPPPGGGHGSGNNQPPSGAPIDGGLSILFLLGTAFGCMKLVKPGRNSQGKYD